MYMTKHLLKNILILLMFAVLGTSKSKAYIAAFTPQTLKCNAEVGSKPIIPPGLPPKRSVDSFGICGPAVAVRMLDQARCELKGKDCSALPDTERSSLTDMTRLALDTKAVSRLQDPDNIKQYPKEFYEGADGASALYNAAFHTKGLAKESCAPFAQFVSKEKTKAKQEEAEKQIWTGFKHLYEKYNSALKGCAKCITDFATTTEVANLQANFGLKTNNLEIANAFAADTYNEFLGQLLVPKECSKDENMISVSTSLKDITYWPQFQIQKDSTFEVTISKIKEVLKKRMILVNRVCLLKDPTKECSDGKHTDGITGSKKICCKENPTNCEELIQVDNNWGETWDNLNNDGWVSARPFFEHTMYSKNNLIWLDKDVADAASSGN
jgi:hypothetical protein